MPLVSCPGCGHSVSSVAPECPRCTRRLHQGAPVDAGNPMPLVIGLLAVLAVIAAVVIGRGVWAARTAGNPPLILSREAKQAIGERLLATAWQAQLAERGRSGRFAASVDQPARRPPLYRLSVSRATERELCIDATPIPGHGGPAGPLSMDQDGALHLLPGCDTSIPVEQKQRDADRLLSAAYQMQNETRYRTGRYVSQPGERDFVAPSPYFELRVPLATADRLCLEAIPRPGSGLAPRSLDHTGWLFETPGCRE